MGVTLDDLMATIDMSLHEFNPMMGHRGCRLAVTYPGNRRDADPRGHRSRHRSARGRAATTSMPEIMIPLVGDVKELKYRASDVVVKTAELKSWPKRAPRSIIRSAP